MELLFIPRSRGQKAGSGIATGPRARRLYFESKEGQEIISPRK